jgi:hypothetical protein
MVGLQILDLPIGVRVPASQPLLRRHPFRLIHLKETATGEKESKRKLVDVFLLS